MHRFKEDGKEPSLGAFKAMLGQKERTKEVNHPIKCTLEDLYKGKTSRINVKRDRICKACSGKGGTKSRGDIICGAC